MGQSISLSKDLINPKYCKYHWQSGQSFSIYSNSGLVIKCLFDPTNHTQGFEYEVSWWFTYGEKDRQVPILRCLQRVTYPHITSWTFSLFFASLRLLKFFHFLIFLSSKIIWSHYTLVYGASTALNIFK